MATGAVFKEMPVHARHMRVAHDGATAHFLKIIRQLLNLDKPWRLTQLACTITLPQLSGILAVWTPGPFRAGQ